MVDISMVSHAQSELQQRSQVPSGNDLQFANLNMATEIVSFSLEMVMFHSYAYIIC